MNFCSVVGCCWCSCLGKHSVEWQDFWQIGLPRKKSHMKCVYLSYNIGTTKSTYMKAVKLNHVFTKTAVYNFFSPMFTHMSWNSIWNFVWLLWCAKTVSVYHHIMQWKLAIFVAKSAHQRRKDRLWNVMSFRNVWYTKFAAFCVFLAFGIVSQGSRHWPTSSMTYFCVICWKSNNSCVVSRFFRLSSLSLNWIIDSETKWCFIASNFPPWLWILRLAPTTPLFWTDFLERK